MRAGPCCPMAGERPAKLVVPSINQAPGSPVAQPMFPSPCPTSSLKLAATVTDDTYPGFIVPRVDWCPDPALLISWRIPHAHDPRQFPGPGLGTSFLTAGDTGLPLQGPF